MKVMAMSVSNPLTLYAESGRMLALTELLFYLWLVCSVVSHIAFDDPVEFSAIVL